MAVREEVLNVRLADILKSKGLKARAEVILKRGDGRALPDVIVDTQGVRVIIEARSHKAGLLDDTVERVTAGICPVSIGLLYPSNIAGSDDVEKALRSARFDADIVYFDRDGLKKQHAEKISIDDLVQTINAARQIQVSEDLTSYHVANVRAVIDEVVKDGLRELDPSSSKHLAAALSKRLGLSNSSEKVVSDELLRIAVFVLFDAMIFQGLVAERFPDKVANVNAATKSGRRNALLTNWEQILKIDYEPIFRIAYDILDVVPNSDFWNSRLDEMATAAAAVQGSGVLAKHDFMGRLFHKLLLRTTGEAFATYYTAIPTAYLLARLAVNLGETPLKDIKAIEDVRVGDLACGSGTLLSAAYTAYRDRYVTESTGALKLEKLHQTLIEDCIWGLDVLDYAAHLTLTTLALHRGSAIFDKSNIWRVPVGRSRKNGPVYLGSLELYFNSLQGWAFVEEEERKNLSGAVKENIDLPEFDLLMMNPPFSRSSGPKVSFAYDIPNKPDLLKRMRSISKNEGFGNIATAGMGAYFVPLAIRYLKEGGRIAFVLPRALLSGVAWQDVRDAVSSSCHLEMVVSNHDPGHLLAATGKGRAKKTKGWAFSEETDIGEVLFIAKKTKRHKHNKTRFVNLFEYPANEYEAIGMADEVLDRHKESADAEIYFDGRVVGTTYLVSQSELDKRNWLYPCVFASRDLGEMSVSLFEQSELVRLDSLSQTMGCDISPEQQMFTKSTVRTSFPVLWTHGVSQNTLRLDEDQVEYGSPRRPKKDAEAFYERHSGRLLVAERPHLKTTPTFALYSDDPILSTPLWEIFLKDESGYAVLAMWLNSTYGILLYLMTATSSQGEIFKMKKDQLEGLRVIDPANIDAKAALALWNEVADEPLKDVGSDWLEAAKKKGLRYKLDQFFAPYMKVKFKKSDYELLATEPIVTHQRRTG